MTAVVSDTGPLNYLVLIEHETILPALFARVIIPDEVLREPVARGAPPKVADWAAALPKWIEVCEPGCTVEHELDKGEEAAIALASELCADFLIVDERRAREKARVKGIEVLSTIGVLIMAAEGGLLDLSLALDRLEQTTAYLGHELMARARQAAARMEQQRDSDGA